MRSRDTNSVRKGRLFLIVSTVIFAISAVAASTDFVEYHEIKTATCDYQVAQGIVSDSIPMSPSGHPSESFGVGDVFFRYGAGWDSLVFNAGWNRGYIHNGAQVRITH